MELTDVIAHSDRIGRIAFVATRRPDGRPHNAPVGIAWIDNDVCAFVANPSVKVTNIRSDPRVHLHWQVGPESNHDSLIVEGAAAVVDTAAGRAELWDRMGYDLNEFEPGGPEADSHVFLKVTPTRATVLFRYGFDGRDEWMRLIDLTESSAEPETAP